MLKKKRILIKIHKNVSVRIYLKIYTWLYCILIIIELFVYSTKFG